jgi:hypothetical protein
MDDGMNREEPSQKRMKEPKQTLIKYLLGELPEVEQTTLEQEFFANQRLFDQLVETENDLVDEYARGRLAPETRQRFEQYYLAHRQRRERASFAEALVARVARVAEMPQAAVQAESRSSRLFPSLLAPKLAWAFSVALVLLVAGMIWLVIQTRRLHQELAANQAEQLTRALRERDLQQVLANEKSRAESLTSELDRLRSETSARETATPANPSASLLATLVLNITGVRGAKTGPPARLIVTPQTQQARIELKLSENEYQRYSVVIQSADGKQIFTRDHLEAAKARTMLSVIVPASKLPHGDYILTLKGVTPGGEIEDVSKSLFRVSPK